METDTVLRLRGEPSAPRSTATRRLASIEFAADKDHLSLARMTAMHVAALLGLPIGRVTDLRLAVDEACVLFMAASASASASGAAAAPGRGPGRNGRLGLRFDRNGETLYIRVSGPAPRRRPDADEHDLGWRLLCALVGEPRWEQRDGVGTLTMTEPIPADRHRPLED